MLPQDSDADAVRKCEGVVDIGRENGSGQSVIRPITAFDYFWQRFEAQNALNRPENLQTDESILRDWKMNVSCSLLLWRFSCRRRRRKKLSVRYNNPVDPSVVLRTQAKLLRPGRIECSPARSGIALRLPCNPISDGVIGNHNYYLGGFMQNLWALVSIRIKGIAQSTTNGQSDRLGDEFVVNRIMDKSSRCGTADLPRIVKDGIVTKFGDVVHWKWIWMRTTHIEFSEIHFNINTVYSWENNNSAFATGFHRNAFERRPTGFLRNDLTCLNKQN